MKNQNPLRISQEALDLDDIISDLNETPNYKLEKPFEIQQKSIIQNIAPIKNNVTKAPIKSKINNKENISANTSKMLSNKQV